MVSLSARPVLGGGDRATEEFFQNTAGDIVIVTAAIGLREFNQPNARLTMVAKWKTLEGIAGDRSRYFGAFQMKTQILAAVFTSVATFAGLAGAFAQSEPLSRGNMAAYCRGEAAGQYGTRPLYVFLGPIVEAADGRQVIDGIVDKGNEGLKRFRCRFDGERRFIDVMAMTSDGS